MFIGITHGFKMILGFSKIFAQIHITQGDHKIMCVAKASGNTTGK